MSMIIKRIMAFIFKLNLSVRGLDLCQQSMEGPVRRPKSNGWNNLTNFPSTKMGCSIRTESDIETAFVLECEENDDIIGFFDQPTTFRYTYLKPNGKKQATKTTPDFFIVDQNPSAKHNVRFVECKPFEKLVELCKQEPDRYSYDEKQGRFISPAIERELKGTNIAFYFYTDHDASPQALANIRHLLDFKRTAKKNSPLEKVEQKIISSVRDSQTATIATVLLQHSGVKVDSILKLIAERKIFIAMAHDKLSEPETCRIFASESASQVYGITKGKKASNLNPFKFPESPQRIEGFLCRHGRQEWLIRSVNTAQQTALVQIKENNHNELVSFKLDNIKALIQSRELEVLQWDTEEDNHTSIMLTASEENQRLALTRHKVVQQILSGHLNREQAAKKLGCSTRTIRRYLNQHSDGLHRRGNGLPELTNHDHGKGNTQKLISGPALEIAYDVIESEYLTPTNKSVMAVYGDYLSACKTNNIKAGSYSWLNRLIKNVDLRQKISARKGNKLANAMALITDNDGLIESRRGTRAFEYVHIDHTQADIAIKFPGRQPEKPWITVAVDSYSRTVLAVYVTMDKPGTPSLFMVIKELIERHCRFPESLFVDGGKEFESVVFEQFCAFYNITIRSRKCNPRGGSAVESVFKQMNEALIHRLTGNTQLMKNPRQLSANVNPFSLALWDFQSFKKTTHEYFYDHYNETEHPAHLMPPNQVLSDSMIRHGERDQRKIDINDELLTVMMLPYDKNGRTRIVQPVKGVERLGKHYTHELFNSSDWLRKKVELRYDPEDDSYVYCNLDGWKRCNRVAVEDRYYPGMDRSTISEGNAASRSFHHPKARAERALPITQKIIDTEKELKDITENAKDSEPNPETKTSSLEITPGRNDMDDF
ncbi:Mu transposase C-terminal domain-containing protein [Endozoicomonas ascidiicola]|uniref:Mu transposase C-terminal domain-containing protein n=1 Tax=Endozoicomonas ascidiicola TaxID=1698521 RepID=UPI000A9E2CC9|nr:Mu transposase C-terminal domain-containing protein [Endozoicomonas ascidiicola]